MNFFTRLRLITFATGVILGPVSYGEAPPNDSTAYKIGPVSFNSEKSDYAPVFYKGGQILFSSNRSNSSALYDKWTMARHSKIYLITPDSVHQPEVIKLKPKAKSSSASATVYPTNDELIFASESFRKKNMTLQKGIKMPVMNLYSAFLSGNKAEQIMPLSVNGDFSNGQPSVSKDGKTLYFASDRLGGLGGTDIYVSTLNANGSWGNPQSLGPDVNSVYNEIYPFIADDGTLYFSCNSPDGYGGYDVYKTHMENGKWTKPESLGPPVNSTADDFSFIITGDKKSGYFTSNRSGGKGEEDIYWFSYNPSTLKYNVSIRVVDAVTTKPIAAASLALDCQQTSNAQNTLTNEVGEKEFAISDGMSCQVEAWSPGYKTRNLEITSVNAGGLLIIALDRDTAQAINATPIASATPTNVSSQEPVPHLPPTPGGPGKVGVMVPITAHCFPSGTSASIIDLKTGNQQTVQPDALGEVHFDLTLDHKYLITGNGISDTISTSGLRPGSQINGACQYSVGQTWVIPNIYYDVNKWNIRKDAAAGLDQLARFMKQYPELEIELTSHTDCRASSRFNMILSARRAKAAVDYMAKKGIKPSRFIAVGYGESRLTNDCYCEPSNYSTCNEPQHQANRRTEVTVLKY